MVLQQLHLLHYGIYMKSRVYTLDIIVDWTGLGHMYASFAVAIGSLLGQKIAKQVEKGGVTLFIAKKGCCWQQLGSNCCKYSRTQFHFCDLSCNNFIFPIARYTSYTVQLHTVTVAHCNMALSLD